MQQDCPHCGRRAIFEKHRIATAPFLVWRCQARGAEWQATTKIVNDDGARWVEAPVRKPRKPPRALRFSEIKVGDQLVLPPTDNFFRKIPTFFIVTDLWFDPVAGEDDETAGRMVAVQQIGPTGEPRHGKRPYTVRGLASNGYRYADIDYIGQCKAFLEGVETGQVVGIGKGAAIRRRPKLPRSGS
jgi:hypothetical protein